MTQFRGHQEIGTIASRFWSCFTEVASPVGLSWAHALSSAFESSIGYMFFLSRSLYLGLGRSQLFYLGKKSVANRRLVQDMVQHSWRFVRRIMCRLFPGTCTARGGKWLLAWMMRSCHTVEHVIATFIDGFVPVDASNIESTQGELRDAQHDSVGWQLNMLDGLLLLRDRELRRQVLLSARGGYPGIKKQVQRTA